MPLPEGKGPVCRGPDCYMTNGPCHPGCRPDARADQLLPVPSAAEQVECTKGSPGDQWRHRVRQVVACVLLVASLATAPTNIAKGVHALIELIGKIT